MRPAYRARGLVGAFQVCQPQVAMSHPAASEAEQAADGRAIGRER